MVWWQRAAVHQPTRRSGGENGDRMSFDGAVIREQRVTFAIAIVKPWVLNSVPDRDNRVVAFSRAFDGLPTILMAQDSNGTPTYYGRRDLVDFMARVPVEAVPWKRYELR